MNQHEPPTPALVDRPRRTRWFLRIPLKWALFLIVVFFVLFPNPAQFVRHVRHISDYNAMIDPDAPQLAAWETEIREALRKKAARARKTRKKHTAAAPPMAADTTPSSQPGASDWNDALSPIHVQRAVQRFVYKKVKYDWDWNVWGSADYMPTVAEMFNNAKHDPKGIIHEDCDGRAVMAASLMRRLGYQSSIVTDLRHVWVVTPQGEWMGPGRGKTMKSTKKGNKLNVAGTISNVPVSLSYGIAVFPFWREVIIALTAWLLLSRRGMGKGKFLLGGILLFQGLLFMRVGILSPGAVSLTTQTWPAWVGLLHIALGMGVLMWPRRVQSVNAQLENESRGTG